MAGPLLFVAELGSACGLDGAVIQVEVDNYKDYRSLPKEVALRLVPKNGRTRRGETLLKPYLDADHTERLCSAFAKQHKSSTR